MRQKTYWRLRSFRARRQRCAVYLFRAAAACTLLLSCAAREHAAAVLQRRRSCAHCLLRCCIHQRKAPVQAARQAVWWLEGTCWNAHCVQSTHVCYCSLTHSTLCCSAAQHCSVLCCSILKHNLHRCCTVHAWPPALLQSAAQHCCACMVLMSQHIRVSLWSAHCHAAASGCPGPARCW